MRSFTAARRRPTTLLVALLTGLGLALAMLTAPTTASAETEPSTRAAGKAKAVRLAIKVTNCKKCQIGLYSSPRAPRGSSMPDLWSQEKTATKKTVVFRVPAKRMKGLYLTVWDDRAVNTGAMPIAVARYQGVRVGKKVSKAKAARSTKGFHCVAGTKQARQTWQLRVDRFPGKDVFTQERGYRIRPYLSPTKKPFGAATRLTKGTMGAQDVAYCKRR